MNLLLLRCSLVKMLRKRIYILQIDRYTLQFKMTHRSETIFTILFVCAILMLEKQVESHPLRSQWNLKKKTRKNNKQKSNSFKSLLHTAVCHAHMQYAIPAVFLFFSFSSSTKNKQPNSRLDLIVLQKLQFTHMASISSNATLCRH